MTLRTIAIAGAIALVAGAADARRPSPRSSPLAKSWTVTYTAALSSCTGEVDGSSDSRQLRVERAGASWVASEAGAGPLQTTYRAQSRARAPRTLELTGPGGRRIRIRSAGADRIEGVLLEERATGGMRGGGCAVVYRLTGIPAGRAVAATAGDRPAPIGVAECDEFVDKMWSCLDSMPADVRDMTKKAFRDAVEAWRDMPASSRQLMGESCRMALDAARDAYASFGCSL